MSISKSSHRCLYMEVEVIMFIFTPLTCLSPGRKRELIFWRSSGDSRAFVWLGSTTHQAGVRLVAVVGCSQVHSGQGIIEAVAQF